MNGFLLRGQWIFSLFLIILFSSCGGREVPVQEMKFDAAKWMIGYEGNYTYRKRMVNDLVHHHSLIGITSDALTALLGPPDVIKEGHLLYNYDRKTILGGLCTAVEAVVFELSADRTVTLVRFNDGGWD